MKVIQINAVGGGGSTGGLAVELLNALRQAGHSGKIFYGVGLAADRDAVKFGQTLDYYAHNALSRLTDHTGRYSKGNTRRLLRALEAEKPDLIHLHNLHGYYLNYPLLFAFLKENRIPVVWTLHDCWPFTGHCTHFVRAGCAQWKQECRDCPQLRRYPKCVTAGDVTGNFRHKREAFTGVERLTLVTPSRWLGELAGQSFLGKYPVRVIPNGVDRAVFSPVGEAFRLEGKHIILGVSNVWNEHKGMGDLLALADSCQLVLVGLTEEQIASLPPNVLGLPRTQNREELAQIYRGARVLVNPSREDTYPTVNLEAQACGVPVVCYDACGCPETVLPGMGSVVPAGDVAALKRETERWAIRERPAPISTQLLDSGTMAEAYLDLYREILGGGEGAGP